jgi:toxin-antitoxin system PIN domain toxin
VFVVDTNILLYAADRDSPDHVPCRKRLDAWRRQSSPWHLTWGIVYELLRVATHPNVFRKPFSLAQAWSFVEATLASPSISMLPATERHRQVAGEVFSELPGMSGNLVFDAHTAILMREHGIKTIYTRDTDFNRFPFVDVVDPLHEHRRTTAPSRHPKGRG